MAKINLTPIPGYIRGFAFVFFVFFSTYFGTIFLLTPVLPMFFMAPRIARLISDFIIWLWKLYCVSIYEVLFQTKVKVYGNIPDSEASTLIIMNHRTRFDWLYLFSYQLRYGSIRRYTISLKNGLKFLPGIGWAMQLAGYIFLDRKWEDDKENISRCLKVFQKIGYRPQNDNVVVMLQEDTSCTFRWQGTWKLVHGCNESCHTEPKILLFPEGTDFTKNTKARSDKFAEKQNLAKYDFVLHPRTTGFCHFVQEMRKCEMLDYVTDVTIAYPVSIPQNETDIIKGKFPPEIHFLAHTYPNYKIPNDKDDLSSWCQDRWVEKEYLLHDFYEKKEFNSETKLLDSNESLITSVLAYAWMFWLILEILFVYLLYSYPLLWIYVVLCTIMYSLISVYTFGLGLFVARSFNI